MLRTTSLRALALTLSAALAAVSLPAGADDIDIFTGASAGPAANPRILIVLDNTSNWSRQNQKWPGGLTQGQAEASAIRRMLPELSESVSLGLLEFVTGGNANQDGGFVRYAIRPMDAANKGAFTTQLNTIYNDINGTNEKRNSNTPYGNLMYDVYNYFTGGTAYSPGGVVASRADSGGYTRNYDQFRSPLTADNICGKSYVIFIGNPGSSGPASDSAANTALLNALNNQRNASNALVPVTQLPLPNFSSQSTSVPTNVGTTSACYASATAAAAALPSFATACANYTDSCTIGPAAPTAPGPACAANTSRYTVVGTDTTVTNVATGTTSTDTGPRNADEWARLLHDRGVPVTGTTVRPSITTYTIDVHNAQPNSEHTSLMLSMARAGGGKYFMAKNEEAILDALREILIEIQAVNSTFASTSLPVNATNRSQNENQVFIGMFRPDPDAKPRWFGNLKRYQLINNGGNIDLGDVAGKPAVNTNTGFVTPCATSYWTTDNRDYWSGSGILPAPSGTCTLNGFGDKPFSDAPDGSFVEKGAAAQILREGNVPKGATTSYALNRTVLTHIGSGLTPLTSANSGLNEPTYKFIRGEDVNNEKFTGNNASNARPSIHGDVIHSRPLPVNYGPEKGGVTVFYGSNDGTLRALNATTGVERWAFVAPEFFQRLQRLRTNSPLVAYPGTSNREATRKDYFFDGSTGIYQDATSTNVWIYPTMRRGGRMIYSLNVSNPQTPVYKWKVGCPNLEDDVGCTAGMTGIGQTWSTPSVAFIKGYEQGTKPVVVVGGGYDNCEDANTVSPTCTATKGNAVYVIDANTGVVIRTFATERAVAADISMVDIDNDAMPDYAYAADVGGKLYRIDFVSSTRAALASAAWTKRTVAQTTGAGRKFLFAPALLATTGYVYVAIGSGDREHPLASQYPYSQVTNRFYVYKDSLTAPSDAAVTSLDALENYTQASTCNTAPVLPSSTLKGWFMDLNANGQGEQVVTSALIAGGMVTFSTNRPIPPVAGTCSTLLGEARGYWVNLLNGAGAIGVPGTCGGQRSSPFVGGGLPPSPVLANGVPINGQATTVVIGAAQKDDGDGGGGDGLHQPGISVPIAPQRIRPAINSKRKRTYSYTSGSD